MIKRSIATGLCLVSTSAYSSDLYQGQHIEFSYTYNCQNSISDLGGLGTNQCSNQVDHYSQSNHLSFDAKELNEPEEELPLYLTVQDGKDWDYLKEQTYTILGLSVATVGFMTLLPESITKWDEDDRDLSKLGRKWKDNVSAGPVWDKDEHVLNYVMHPYFGGVYYTAARHSGFNEFESFVYSWTMSTFFWEYGVEAFAEVPSYQDLFITPFFGALVGELMFEAEQDIVANGGTVMESETLGNVSLFFLNPVGHIHYWITDAWGDETEFNLTTTPWFGNQEAANYALDAGAAYDYQFVGLNLSLKF
ncbi:DUF3943 domain-containing protein [Vibrio sp. HN007]|uniref:DUF3943 domain-containing protein n=1 Tax=Vibrio iocasae TaxID=3098914 RepID=UPI0035D4606E